MHAILNKKLRSKMDKEINIAAHNHKIKQFYHEIQTWERLLDFFKQESVYLKTQLSEVVDQLTGKEFLELAENFQNRLIIKDEFIDELRHDVNDLKINLKSLFCTIENKYDEKLIKKKEMLRNELENFKKEFTRDRIEFTKFLASIT